MKVTIESFYNSEDKTGIRINTSEPLNEREDEIVQATHAASWKMGYHAAIDKISKSGVLREGCTVSGPSPTKK